MVRPTSGLLLCRGRQACEVVWRRLFYKGGFLGKGCWILVTGEAGIDRGIEWG